MYSQIYWVSILTILFDSISCNPAETQRLERYLNDDYIEDIVVDVPSDEANYEFANSNYVDSGENNTLSSSVKDYFENVYSDFPYKRDNNRQKKSQVLCRVEKSIHHHTEMGYDFFPKSYVSYSCRPADSIHFADGSSSHQDVCFVNGTRCITIEKEHWFTKHKHNTNCWKPFREVIAVGCKCLPRKHHF
ncbi:uncharacterized protein LOC132697317 isoform X2 [Cylas formicarius]|uniref:uncharacterized protein LOC132697317 isoform X2 n=1 Tax=Cylas formicarius TaxID=197179 RepID=UPI00295865A2|nr:uncharacterized protein LOC132697317 isoform X2 [Cylas formicarius]